ncbi:hypothetical protein RF11_10897 [Thelohanellus kitauei]|uniref:Uncharacterized protein n=1 Tax=Thelohanellus kitauei TaxID=669202 RepID=A0A0C2J5S7_THEKT|nr:hypothetical protein RF11_10897 [Thelohanellus kitauei]
MDINSTVQIKTYFINNISPTLDAVSSLKPTFFSNDNTLVMVHDDEFVCCVFGLTYEVTDHHFHIHQRNGRVYSRVKLNDGLNNWCDRKMNTASIQNNTTQRSDFLTEKVFLDGSHTYNAIILDISLNSARWIKLIGSSTKNIDDLFDKTYKEMCKYTNE